MSVSSLECVNMFVLMPVYSAAKLHVEKHKIGALLLWSVVDHSNVSDLPRKREGSAMVHRARLATLGMTIVISLIGGQALAGACSA